MTNATKLFIVIGCLFLLLAVFLRLTWFPIVIAASPLKSGSFLILANTAFLVALLCKK